MNQPHNYPDVQLLLHGEWRRSSSGQTMPVYDPATGDEIGRLAKASREDIDAALQSTAEGFKVWKSTSPNDRSIVLRKSADHLRRHIDSIAWVLTREQGKPLAQAHDEIVAAAEVLDWFSEEAKRLYGRLVPANSAHITQMVVREPVGPVAAFSPWNFPIGQAVRKVAAAIASGCSIILKGPEETPASCAALADAFVAAGLPPGVFNLVFGVPAEISEQLIADPIVRKVTFTGSTPVGKQLAALAGAHMKRITMELGGHAPVLVFDDADVATAARLLAGMKFRNAGQVCVSPTRFLVQETVAADFEMAFIDASQAIITGSGLEALTTMGPLANSRRVGAMESLVQDACARGARVAMGGGRLGRRGNFFAPTLLVNTDIDTDVMNHEPFGPIAALVPFRDIDTALAEANRLPFGLAAYAFTRSLKTATEVGRRLECGMVSINHYGLASPELHFGGIKDSGYGSEGGVEAMDSYLQPKLITQIGV